MSNSANICKLESLATLDGEGIRYAVFFNGCPLRCVYCHNPESWATSGVQYTVDQLAKKLLRYKTYFGTNGGITWSGGEPLLHSNFINEVSEILRQNGISYVVDTSGCVELTESVKKVLQNSTMVLLDVKMWDKESYGKYCNGDIQDMIKVGDYLQSIGKRVWIRTVIVPNINDKEEILLKYCDIYKRWDNVEKVELLGFHTLGFNKYDSLGIVNPLANTLALNKGKLIELQKFVNMQIDKKKNNN